MPMRSEGLTASRPLTMAFASGEMCRQSGDAIPSRPLQTSLSSASTGWSWSKGAEPLSITYSAMPIDQRSTRSS